MGSILLQIASLNIAFGEESLLPFKAKLFEKITYTLSPILLFVSLFHSSLSFVLSLLSIATYTDVTIMANPHSSGQYSSSFPLRSRSLMILFPEVSY